MHSKKAQICFVPSIVCVNTNKLNCPIFGQKKVVMYFITYDRYHRGGYEGNDLLFNNIKEAFLEFRKMLKDEEYEYISLFSNKPSKSDYYNITKLLSFSSNTNNNNFKVTSRYQFCPVSGQ